MNIYTVRDNLKNTIAGKERMLAQYQSALACSYAGPTPPPGAEMACIATIQFLEINIDELKRVLQDVEQCVAKDIEMKYKHVVYQVEWVPVTQKLLNEQHPWLYQPMWIAMKGGVVVQGYYEWRQGRNPDRFITDLGDEWAFNADFVMPITKPTPPAIEAAHGIKE